MTPEQRAAIDAAYSEMEAANIAVQDASSDAALERAHQTFERARVKHTAAKAAGERAEAIAQAKRNLPFGLDQMPGPTGISGMRVTSEPLTYHERSPHSFLYDQFHASKGDRRAAERLGKHMGEMVTENVIKDDELRAIAETAGAGGELVAPLFWQEQYVALARAARPYVDTLRKVPLPPHTNSISIPRMVSGTAVAAQVDLGAVQSTDLATGLLTFPVITEAGQQDFARQLWDRSQPELLDMVVFPDLIADYNTKVDIQAISGSGTGGNAKGVLLVSGVNASTYTSGAPTAAGLYSKIADVIQQIHTTRFLPPTQITMHPRRWGWFLAATDSTGRPLVVPTAAQGPMNSLADMQGVVSQGVVGTLLGLPVVLDPSIPINLGAGSNEDRVIVQRVEDSLFLEDGPIKTRVFEEVLSGVLAIRAQVFNYLALTHERYPKAIGVVSGTGLIAPTF